MSDWNKQIIEEFRANKGHVGGHFENTPLLLLHTTGAKSGQLRINPVAYVKDGDRFVIVASKGGAPENPDWYYNLLAHPEVTIEVGAETLKVEATAAEEPERTRLFDQMAAKNPGFDEYRKKTTRQIPVIVLTPQM
ncbi:MAG: nitroreductase family deazaflavin-dependent oxidoreductase [Anaerolineales bacterium]|nr:nitroreductase family deazaflavin-dependent oxidoreductase [Anaerolineales bacterium]